MDIKKAREQLLDQERLRPGPEQFSALWEEGQSWNQSFAELGASERADDTRFESLVDVSDSFEQRRALLQQWVCNVREGLDWYAQRIQALGALQLLWGEDARGRSLAPPELFAQQARLARRAADRKVRSTLIELEYLEYRRRYAGKLNEPTWGRAHTELFQAFREQVGCYQQPLGGASLDKMYGQRLRGCQRLQQIQAATRQAWGSQRNVDWAGLRADAAKIDQIIASLQPRQVPYRLHWIGAVALVALLAIGFVLLISRIVPSASDPMGGTSSTRAPRTPTARALPNATVVQNVPSAIALSGDLVSLNAQGLDLLKQGQCAQAIPYFQAATKVSTNRHDAYEPLDNMAFCLYDLGQVDDALTAWQDAQAREPGSPDVNAGLGLALYNLKKLDEAYAAYNQACAIDRQNYSSEDNLRTNKFWSARAISDSRPLRAAPGACATP